MSWRSGDCCHFHIYELVRTRSAGGWRVPSGPSPRLAGRCAALRQYAHRPRLPHAGLAGCPALVHSSSTPGRQWAAFTQRPPAGNTQIPRSGLIAGHRRPARNDIERVKFRGQCQAGGAVTRKSILSASYCPEYPTCPIHGRDPRGGCLHALRLNVCSAAGNFRERTSAAYSSAAAAARLPSSS